jgi:hypothetical protein
MPESFWIFSQSAAGVMCDSPGVHEQLIPCNCENAAWIIIHCHFWIILAIIFLNIVFLSLALYGTKQKGKWFKHNCRYTETLTPPSDWRIFITHGVNVSHSVVHLIWSDQSRNTQVINGAKLLKVLLVFADDLYMTSGWNWIPISIGSICEI